MLREAIRKAASSIYHLAGGDVLELNKVYLGMYHDTDVLRLNMDEESEATYLREAAAVANSQAFKRTMQQLLNAQVEYVAKEAPRWENVLVSRGSINGISKVIEEFERLRDKHENRFGTTNFDAFSVI